MRKQKLHKHVPILFVRCCIYQSRCQAPAVIDPSRKNKMFVDRFIDVEWRDHNVHATSFSYLNSDPLNKFLAYPTGISA